MPVLKLEDLRSAQLRALPRERTLFVLPIGAIEDHGDALPLALDLVEAEAVSRRVAEMLEAEDWTIVLAARVPLAIDANTSALAIRMRPHVVRDYLVDYCDSLAQAGFRYFMAVSGHPGPRQLTAIEEAGRFLRKRHLRFGIFPNARAPVLVSASSVAIDDDEKSQTLLFMAPREHGGARDASIALAFAGDRTDTELLGALPKTSGLPTLVEHFRKFRRREISGYVGDPAAGTVTRGKASVDEKAKTIALKFRAAVEGGKPHQIFKSWYSLVPSNQSLFKVWLLVALLTITLAAWVLLSLQTFMQGADFGGT